MRVEERAVRRRSGFVSHEINYVCPDCSDCASKTQCTRTEANRTLRHNPQLVAYQAEARQRLASEEGVALRRRRGWEVETHFGMLKKNLRYTRLRLRGWAKATLEIGYLATVLNLTRLAGLQVQPI